jgi:hypothetical protein
MLSLTMGYPDIQEEFGSIQHGLNKIPSLVSKIFTA